MTEALSKERSRIVEAALYQAVARFGSLKNVPLAVLEKETWFAGCGLDEETSRKVEMAIITLADPTPPKVIELIRRP